MATNGSSSWFPSFARSMANASGKPATFLIAVLVIIVWAVTGPIFGYSDTWQLVINTGTTIVTFLMVFIIQNTQQLKLDELIRVTKGAHNLMLDLEQLDDEHLERLRQVYEKLANKARSENKTR